MEFVRQLPEGIRWLICGAVLIAVQLASCAFIGAIVWIVRKVFDYARSHNKFDTR